MDVLNVEVTASDEELDNDDRIQRVVDGLNINDLSTSGAEFSVQVSEDAAFDEQRLYEGPNLFPHLNINCLGGDEDEDEDDVPESHDSKTPFAILASKMTNLTDDGKVKKRILSEGYGEVVPTQALVWFHHNSYAEFVDAPFDSSYLRGSMTMIRLGSGKCILGLDIGLSTMKLGEKAEFLIHHDYAYGKLGVLPRIPSEAEILIKVEMKKFVDNALALKMGELNEDELKSMSFEEIYKGALSLLYEGNRAFSERKFPLALKWYRNAIRSLENCDMKSDDDDLKNEALRLKLYTNMGVCHNKLNNSKQAIVACRNALQLKPDGAKIFYQLSLAHLNLSSFDEAKKFAFKARQLAPYNPDVSVLLQKIDSKMERYCKSSVSFAKNAFKYLDIKKVDKSVGEGDHSKTADNKELHEENHICLEGKFSRGVKITEISEDENKISPGVTDMSSTGEDSVVERESSKENIIAAEDSYNEESENVFQQESIQYIEEFVQDPSQRQLPLPPGLTYEEELFFKKQALLYDLRLAEKQEEGKSVVYLLK